MYTLMESAKLAGVKPAAYLREGTLRAIANPGTVTMPAQCALAESRRHQVSKLRTAVWGSPSSRAQAVTPPAIVCVNLNVMPWSGGGASTHIQTRKEDLRKPFDSSPWCFAPSAADEWGPHSHRAPFSRSQETSDPVRDTRESTAAVAWGHRSGQFKVTVCPTAF